MSMIKETGVIDGPSRGRFSGESIPVTTLSSHNCAEGSAEKIDRFHGFER